MTTRWANHSEAGTGDDFHVLHAGLTIQLVLTERALFKTCAPHEALADVLARNTDSYDFLPVVNSEIGSQGRIVGLFHAEKFSGENPVQGRIEEHFEPLSEDHLIGANASIRDFVIDADYKPCRLAISGSEIIGLVSLSDLQKLPVRAALFAMITGFELTMSEAIKVAYPNDDDWKRFLSAGRQKEINKRIEQSHQNDSFVDALLFTLLSDKLDILLNGFQLPENKDAFGAKLKQIRLLRNKLAHADDYAESPKDARHVCAVVRDLLELRRVVGDGLEITAQRGPE